MPHGHRRARGNDTDERRQHLRLVEDEDGAVPILLPRRVRHERRRADAQHLRDGEDDEREVAGDADAGHGLLSQPSDPVQIDEEVERLEDHRHQHVARWS